MTLLYGLDLGTSTIKAAAYDPEVGRTVALCARPTPVEHLANGWSEHDPEALWQAAAGCLRALRQQVPDRAVAGLAIASFAEAGIALDQHLRPLYPIIAWYDRRTEAQVKWWEAQIDPVALHAITGQQLSPTFGANKWLWIREHVPAAATRLGAWLSVPDYVLWRLTGELATDYSLASRTMLFDQAACGWSPPLLAAVGLTPDQLPRLAPAGTVAGAVTASAAAETGLPPGTPCALGGHDHLCAAFAAGAYKPGSVVDSAGTAEAV
ncbi:MAG TPA: FGGY family carbohydrate kinase, partial [Anaerolineae bacterium]